MPIPLTAEEIALQSVARDVLNSNQARAENRRLLDGDDDPEPSFWSEAARLGWLGMHLPEEYGGGGAGLSELVAILEEHGRAVAPGPLLPTVVASAVIDRHGDTDLKGRVLPGLADGSSIGACGVAGSLRLDDLTVSGDAGVVLGVGRADLILLRCDNDMVLLDPDQSGVRVEIPAGLDKGCRVGRVRLDAVSLAPLAVLRGAAGDARSVLRTLAAAEAVGGARQCLDDAVAYAKLREQFGRPIGSFQAVKHHCADMLVETELATASVWDAARASVADGKQFELAAAVAAAVAVPAYANNAKLNIQVHGGIGFTWEHDAHLLLRRAIAIQSLLSPGAAAREVAQLAVDGVQRDLRVALPAEIEAQRKPVREVATRLAALPEEQRTEELIRTKYAVPHWPEPWGLAATPGLQLLIEEELIAADVPAPSLGITGWVILTLIQHANARQIDRWVHPAMAGAQTWCQLFSEPGAGSDAAAVATRASRVEGGWTVTGQKVWTSGAASAAWGLATVRTDRDSAKHRGITMMAIDMSAPGVEVRPIRQISGAARFNEVFLSDVFVPDEDVVGGVGEGWTVARSTLGNERISIGSGQAGDPPVEDEIVALFAGAGCPVSEAERVGSFLARAHAGLMLNMRRAERAVAGAEPGPEGNLTKLLRAQRLQAAADVQLALLGPEVAAADPETDGGRAAMHVLESRARSIAGGTSEITRNQIAERILGLPRERRCDERRRM